MRRTMQGCKRLLAVCLVAVTGGCGPSRAASSFDDSSSGPNGNGSDASTLGDASSGGDGPSLGSSMGHDDGGPCAGLHCSDDLHSVLDCGNRVVRARATRVAPTAAASPRATARARTRARSAATTTASIPDRLDESPGLLRRLHRQHVATPVSITVDRAGQTLDVSSFARIPSGSGQSLTYAPLPGRQAPARSGRDPFPRRVSEAAAVVSVSCPAGVTPAYTAADAAIHGTGIGDAFHITTSHAGGRLRHLPLRRRGAPPPRAPRSFCRRALGTPTTSPSTRLLQVRSG